MADSKPDYEISGKAGILPPYRILLVDDQEIIHEALRRMLAGVDDLELHSCIQGADAMRTAEELKPAVILQDLIMPDIDGLMLVKFYRANEKIRDVPVVVLSSKEEAKTKAEAFANGANDYLVKLPDKIELFARLRYHAKAHAALLERNAALEELRRISITDGLTKIYNRRYFDQVLEQEFQRARRQKESLSLIILDVDHFKQYNDYYGHKAGDECLVEVADALRSSVHRASDTVARYGGEEFVAILPDTDRDGACAIAERIRQAIIKRNIKHQGSSVAKHVTASLGVATLVPTGEAKPTSLIKCADQGLYQAKGEGRNRVAFFQCKCWE